MEVLQSEFIKSSSSIDQCPEESLPEFAFIGRSNVGKSSLINMLTNNKKLAKVSGRPGKTQLINHFLINKSWFLVDLPGYGWARVAKTEKAKWGEMIHDYLIQRSNLMMTFVLVDSRLDPQPIDVEFINWLGEQGLPLSILFTKSDKQSKNKSQSAMAKYRRILKTSWNDLPPLFLTSSASFDGKEDVLNYIEEVLALGN